MSAQLEIPVIREDGERARGRGEEKEHEEAGKSSRCTIEISPSLVPSRRTGGARDATRTNRQE